MPSAPLTERIDLDDPASIQAWSQRLGVTPVQLKAAVGTVGTDPQAVGRYLREQRDPTRHDELAAAERDLGIRD